MIPVSDAKLTPDIVSQLNKLAFDGMKGASRPKKASTKRSTARASK